MANTQVRPHLQPDDKHEINDVHIRSQRFLRQLVSSYGVFRSALALISLLAS